MQAQPESRATLGAWTFPATAAALLGVVIHLCLVLSAARGQVPSFWPHFDGSASVSKACRQDPSVHWFRAVVLPCAPLLALQWWIAARWLRARALSGPRLARWVVGLGVAGALFLVLYATFLGTDGRVYRLMRRWGVYVFFGGTSIAQALVTLALSRARTRFAALELPVLRTLQAIFFFQLLAGPLNVVAGRLIDEARVANALEWWFAIAMALALALLARVWWRDGLVLEAKQADREQRVSEL